MAHGPRRRDRLSGCSAVVNNLSSPHLGSPSRWCSRPSDTFSVPRSHMMSCISKTGATDSSIEPSSPSQSHPHQLLHLYDQQPHDSTVAACRAMSPPAYANVRSTFAPGAGETAHVPTAPAPRRPLPIPDPVPVPPASSPDRLMPPLDPQAAYLVRYSGAKGRSRGHSTAVGLHCSCSASAAPRRCRARACLRNAYLELDAHRQTR